MSQVIIYLTDVDKFESAGLPWRSVAQARWAHRTRAETGTSDAFIRIGRRIAVDPARWHELVRRGQQS